MIRHTVSFALVHSPGSAAEAEFLGTGRRTLTAIPGVHDFTVSRQVSPKSDHTFQFSMRFADQADYDAYDAHPDHQAFVSSRWQTEVTSYQELDLVPVD
ncbi:Dabb family protein [Leifsonia kafniensis]|uniref:Dabb family protein n=1 Tax=Leifsonia kafniensis TaxID=475957 RepID=A0ABP7L4W5_9MICO